MSAVLLILSLFLAAIGGTIWRFKLVGLLANVDKSSVTDRDGLARWTGISLLLLATVILLESIVLWLVKTDRGELIVCALFMFTTHMTTVFFLSGLHRYTK